MHSKVCGSVSESAFGTDYCDPSQAGKTFRISAEEKPTRIFRKQNGSMPESPVQAKSLGTWVAETTNGLHYALIFALAFVAICCCCCTFRLCQKDRDDYRDDISVISEKSCESRQPSLLSTMSQLSADEEDAFI